MKNDKDDLLEWLENWYEFYGDTSPERREGKKQYLAHNQIRSIIEQHFSISDSERKEAVEYVNKALITVSKMPWAAQERKLKTILKALGEEK